jgi:Holliday junction DNA helicase RuvA
LQVGAEATLWIEHIIRAESQTLCGFLSHEEQLLFKEITGVQGVGAKIGLSILSALSPRDIIAAIVNQDKHALTMSDGVGTKMAERIIIELKNSKFVKTFSSTQEISPAATDAVKALVALGYENVAAQKVVLGLLKELGGGASVEGLIKAALLKLSRGS